MLTAPRRRPAAPGFPRQVTHQALGLNRGFLTAIPTLPYRGPTRHWRAAALVLAPLVELFRPLAPYKP